MATTDSDTLNYRGELMLIGNVQTPLLTMMGGMGAGRRSASFQFPMSSPYSLSAASQDVQSEDTAGSAGTPATVATSQVYNVCQIMKKDVKVTFKKQSQVGAYSGVNVDGANPIPGSLAFQRNAQLKQLALDINYSFIKGTFVDESSSATAVATRGLEAAIATNIKAAAGAPLDKTLMDYILRTAADAGVSFENLVIFAAGFQKQKISDIYGYAPMDRNVGGLNIKQIETDFGMVGVTYEKNVTASSILLVDMNAVQPVFVPVSPTFDGETGFQADMAAGAEVLWVPTGLTAAAHGGFLYTQVGLDYGNENLHAAITGLSTS
jgi:hypothetical protein